MLNWLIRFSLRQRALVLVAAVLLLVFGWQTARDLPIEVLPDLTKPTVTILTEAPGLSPEEVEVLVTVPMETALVGVSGLTRLRSISDVSLSLIYIELQWGSDIVRARQNVQERLRAMQGKLPPGVVPYMTPVASLMGEIMLVGMRSVDGEVEPRDLRTLADWNVRQRLQGIPGIAEVLNMGGGVKQVQVEPDPERMLALGVSFEELRQAAAAAASNTTGGTLTSAPREIMVRHLAMTTDLGDIGSTVVKQVNDRPIKIADVADVVWGVAPMRGDAAVNGTRGVILSITKSPGFDTLDLTAKVEDALAEMRTTLPGGVEVVSLFRQADYIEHAIGNLGEAVRDGALMVVVILFLFLLNVRTTFITLMAMPLSFSVTVLVFRWMEISVNSMTLGGLAVAIGMVVDDAIVDVENVFRRLRENARLADPRPRLEVIAEASAEVRNSILYATVFIILVFVPLLGLTGVAGRLFTPIAVATMVSMSASFVVSLTVIPVLCHFLLRPRKGRAHGDSRFLRALKWFFKHTWLRLALDFPLVVLTLAAVLVAGALTLYPMMGSAFLPPFQEETALVALMTAPGTSIRQTNEMSDIADRLLSSIPEVRKVGRRLGRAERGDHVVPVSTAEFDIDFETGESSRSRAEVLEHIREKMRSIPGTFSVLSGPLADRVGHMLSGVSASVAIKVYGQDLGEIRRVGTEIQEIARTIPGLETARVEQQAPIPQLRIEVDRQRAQAYGVRPGEVNAQLATLIGGEVVAELYEGQRTVDLVLRLPEFWRESPTRLRRLYIDTLSGQRIPLHLVAKIRPAKGPNVIKREGTQRRFVVSINPRGRDHTGLVRRLQKEVREKVDLPEDVFVSFEGEFEAQREATSRIVLFSLTVLVIIAFLLYTYFKTAFFAAQVLADVPLALIGGVIFTYLTLQNISIATLVGFIAIAGIAARNSVMLLSHYLHLMRHEGEGFTRSMVERGTLERLVPVCMTALSAGIALIPLVLAVDQPGKEILHPVALVIVGGLVTSTFLGLGVTPAVFYTFGRRAAHRAVERKASASD